MLTNEQRTQLGNELFEIHRWYDGRAYLRMIATDPIDAAHRLLARAGGHTGFQALVEQGHPELTVEWVVLQDPWCESGEFSDEELDGARHALRSWGIEA